MFSYQTAGKLWQLQSLKSLCHSVKHDTMSVSSIQMLQYISGKGNWQPVLPARHLSITITTVVSTLLSPVWHVLKHHCTFSACTLTNFSRDGVSAPLRYRLTKRLILLMPASLQMQFTKLPELSRAPTTRHSKHRNAFPARGGASIPHETQYAAQRILESHVEIEQKGAAWLLQSLGEIFTTMLCT